tara:strand:- start:15444 stop:15557 length:114 start_codon:yes stop_codon:yes gene_type:complete
MLSFVVSPVSNHLFVANNENVTVFFEKPSRLKPYLRK